jgi:hypothetical protein
LLNFLCVFRKCFYFYYLFGIDCLLILLLYLFIFVCIYYTHSFRSFLKRFGLLFLIRYPDCSQFRDVKDKGFCLVGFLVYKNLLSFLMNKFCTCISVYFTVDLLYDIIL